MKRVFPIFVGLTLVFNSKSAAGSLDRQIGIIVAEGSFRSFASSEGLHLSVWSGQQFLLSWL